MRTILLTMTAMTALTAAAAPKPNVLLICVDDLKPMLGCYGDASVKSPNIDQLAARALRFDRAYCNQAVCSPSRNTLLTGLRPQTLGIYDLATNFRKSRPDAVTLPQYFKQNGWRTEAMGKIFHVGHGNTEDAASWSVPHWSPKPNAFGGYVLPENRPASLTREEARAANAKADAGALPRGAPTECADVPDSAYADGMTADEAIVRLRAAATKPAEPFFIAVGFLKPHLPFVAPKKYWDLYRRDDFKPHPIQTPPKGAPVFAPQFGGELRQYSDIPETGPIGPEKQKELIHGYHAAVSYMDAQLGRVMAAFDELGLASNTIVVLWGDHGWHLGDHGMWCKHTNYEQAGRIPFMLLVPGAKPGIADRTFAESVDLYPTLCDLAGLSVPAGLDGLSLAPVVADHDQVVRTSATHVYPRGSRLGRAVRTERYRLVEWKDPGAAAETAICELYDYQEDPDETKNLADERPAVVAELRAVLAKQPEAKPQIKAGAAAKPAPSGKDRGAMFDERDRNHDGRLTREEFLLNQPDPDEAPKRFPKFDKDGDGLLTREEFVKAGKS